MLLRIRQRVTSRECPGVHLGKLWENRGGSSPPRISDSVENQMGTVCETSRDPPSPKTVLPPIAKSGEENYRRTPAAHLAALEIAGRRFSEKIRSSSLRGIRIRVPNFTDAITPVCAQFRIVQGLTPSSRAESSIPRHIAGTSDGSEEWPLPLPFCFRTSFRFGFVFRMARVYARTRSVHYPFLTDNALYWPDSFWQKWEKLSLTKRWMTW